MRLISTSILLFALLCCAGQARAEQAKTSRPAAAPLAATPANQVKASAPAPSAAVAVLELELIQVLALSPADKRAVLALPDQQMLALATGDKVPRTRAVLTQVMADKIVVDETSADGKTVQMVWMYKGQGAKPGRIERLALTAAPDRVADAPRIQMYKLSAPTAPARK